jgi:hypothetical protein
VHKTGRQYSIVVEASCSEIMVVAQFLFWGLAGVVEATHLAWIWLLLQGHVYQLLSSSTSEEKDK